MKKLNLKLGGIKEMLTQEQMKQIVGGYTLASCYWIESAHCTGNQQTHRHYIEVGGNYDSATLIDICMIDVDLLCSNAGDCCDGDAWTGY